jgi:trimeric autotransporter adhesin
MNHRGPATLRAVRFAALAAMSLYSPVHAQPCWEVSWQPGQGVPGVSGVVHAAALWDPDGSGPRSPVVVFGGDFALAGDQPARNLATWDPATGRWSQLMGGTDGPVRAILVRGSGQLVIAGDFTSAGGVAASRIAQQDGLILRPLGAGVDAPVHALL